MTKTRLSAFLALTLLASVTLTSLAPTAAAHTCYGPDCGPCVPGGEAHEHDNQPYSYCWSAGDDSGCDIHVRPICIIIECLASDLVSLGLAVPRLAALEGTVGSACAG